MTYPWQPYKYTCSMPSGATLSTAMGPLPGHFERVGVEIHSMASGTDIYFKVSHDGTTYRRLYHSPGISNANPGPIYLASSVTNCNVELDHDGFKYWKVELSTAMTATTACFNLVFY